MSFIPCLELVFPVGRWLPSWIKEFIDSVDVKHFAPMESNIHSDLWGKSCRMIRLEFGASYEICSCGWPHVLAGVIRTMFTASSPEIWNYGPQLWNRSSQHLKNSSLQSQLEFLESAGDLYLNIWNNSWICEVLKWDVRDKSDFDGLEDYSEKGSNSFDTGVHSCNLWALHSRFKLKEKS